MRELATGYTPTRMLEPFSFRFHKSVLERPLTGRRGMVMPPLLSNQVTHKHPRTLGCNHTAEGDRVLSRLRAVLRIIVDVAPAAPEAHPFVPGVAAGVLAATTHALHVRAHQVYAPLRGQQPFP